MQVQGHYIVTMYGDITVVKELIKVWNAAINARDNIGETALRFARNLYRRNIV